MLLVHSSGCSSSPSVPFRFFLSSLAQHFFGISTIPRLILLERKSKLGKHLANLGLRLRGNVAQRQAACCRAHAEHRYRSLAWLRIRLAKHELDELKDPSVRFRCLGVVARESVVYDVLDKLRSVVGYDANDAAAANGNEGQRQRVVARQDRMSHKLAISVAMSSDPVASLIATILPGKSL